MAEAERLWGAVQQPAIDVARNEELSSGIPPTTRARGRWRYATGLAASVTIVAGLTWLHFGGYDRLRSDAYTSVGEIRRVTLSDGSVVTLNTDTALQFNLDSNRREVKLLHGEAYFEVVHDAHRPFVVDSAVGSARVLGTAFNVRLDRDQARVSVVEGRVSVASAGNSSVLAKGQSAWLSANGIEAEADRDVFTVKAWQRGQIIFYRTPVSEVVAEIGRYRSGLVMVRGEALRRMQISGAFEVADPDAGLQLVRATLGVRSISVGDWITVLY